MSAAGWIVVGVLGVAVAWLALALVGAARELDRLRGRVDALEEGPGRSPRELPVGSVAPAWRIATAEGEVVSSSTFGGDAPRRISERRDRVITAGLLAHPQRCPAPADGAPTDEVGRRRHGPARYVQAMIGTFQTA